MARRASLDVGEVQLQGPLLSEQRQTMTFIASEQDIELPRGNYHVEGKPRKVGVYFSFTSISEIDTMKQTFATQFIMNVTWLPTEEEVAQYRQTPATFAPEFIPRYYIVGAEGEPVWTYRKFDGKNFHFGDPESFATEGFKGVLRPWLFVWEANVTATIRDPLDLKYFPVDVQDLTIIVQTGVIQSSVTVPSFISQTLVKVDQDRLDQTEWTWLDFFLEIMYTSISSSTVGNQYSRVVISAKVERRWSSYFWRDCFSSSLITLATLAAFTMEPDEGYNDRLSLVATLMVTLAATNYVVHADLPAVSYLTLMHKFMMGCFTFVLLVGFLCVLLRIWGAGPAADKVAGLSLLATWATFMVGNFGVWLWHRARERAALLKPHTVQEAAAQNTATKAFFILSDGKVGSDASSRVWSKSASDEVQSTRSSSRRSPVLASPTTARSVSLLT